MERTTTRYKSISYRAGEFTSKITLQPAIYEIMDEIRSGDGYGWLAGKAADAKLSNQCGISGYVRDMALLQIFPRGMMKGYKFDTSIVGVPYRVFDEDGNKIANSTVTMPNILMYFLERVHGNNARFLVEEIANVFLKGKTTEGRDLSFNVREYLLNDIYENYYEGPR